MRSKRYRSGFVAGVATGAGVVLGALSLVNVIRSRNPRVVRLQKSLQIGSPVERVFKAWSELENLGDWSDTIRSITRNADRSHWVADIGGRRIEWDAQIEQFIPNQSIGWKSLNGPKHTGRINFSPLGDNTVINVTMNYAPPSALLRPFVAPFTGDIESYMDQVLREFKAALEEEKRPSQSGLSGTHLQSVAGPERATGTFGAAAENASQTERSRFGAPPSPAEYTRPPESKP